METIVWPDGWLLAAFIAACVILAAMWINSKCENYPKIPRLNPLVLKRILTFGGLLIVLAAPIGTGFILGQNGTDTVIIYCSFSGFLILMTLLYCSMMGDYEGAEFVVAIYIIGIVQAVLALFFVMCVSFSYIWVPLTGLIVSLIGYFKNKC